MKEKTNINIKIDKDLKEAAENLFDDFGIDMTTAINLFLKQSVYEHKIPFSIRRDIPNKETVAAMEEGLRLALDKNTEKIESEEDLRKSFGL